MAGSNPYRLYSFEELRAIAGKSWLVCDWCRRFAPLAGNLRGRDTRTTTFSCSDCGGVARHVFEDPAKTGKLQFDPRQRPTHHVEAKVRLRAASMLRQLQERRGEKVAREDLPQARREHPSQAPAPNYTLKPFPIRAFGDIAAWGLKAAVHCGNCRRPPVPLEVGANLKPMALLRPTLRCSGIIRGNAVSPDRVCGGRGQIWMSPAEHGGTVPDAPFIGACCYNHVHTGLEARYLVVDRPPWQGMLAGDERFACPGCMRLMHHSWATIDKRPQPKWRC